MSDRFAVCVQRLFKDEGGFVNHPNDPGGATNMGITHKTLSQWRGYPVSVQDVAELTQAEAAMIYHANYWDTWSGCPELPAGVDYVVFDMAVNAGVHRSAKMLQEVVGTTPRDGKVGPNTLADVNEHAPDFVVNAFSDRRLSYYKSLPHWDTFGEGWTNRTERVRGLAIGDTQSGAPDLQQQIDEIARRLTELEAEVAEMQGEVTF